MIELAVASLCALACLCLILVVFSGVRQSPAERETSLKGRTLAGLSGASVEQLDLILQSRDYRSLDGPPELRAARSRLRRDRRKIALMWLTDLQNDVHVVWRFRRFLVRNGLSVTFQDEAGILVAALLSLASLTAARTTVFVCGPFAFVGVVHATGMTVKRLSQRCDGLLSSVSGEKRSAIEQKWEQEVLATARA